MATTEVRAGAADTRLVGTLSLEEERGRLLLRDGVAEHRSICVPLDGSSASEQALPLAHALAARLGARVSLVHVHKPGVDRAYTGRGEYARRENEQRCEESRYLWSKVDGLGREPTAASVLLAGRVPDALLRFVRENGSDLLLMTRHGAGGAGGPWLGSVADRVIRSARVPVLLAPEADMAPDAGASTSFRKVLVPLDGSGAAEEVLEHALALGEPGVATFVLAQVEEPQPTRAGEGHEPRRAPTAAQRYLHYVAEQLRARGVEVEVRVVEDARPAEALLKLAATERADLLALTLHGEGGRQRRMLGAVADKLIRASRGAMLLYRPRGGRLAPRTV